MQCAILLPEMLHFLNSSLEKPKKTAQSTLLQSASNPLSLS